MTVTLPGNSDAHVMARWLYISTSVEVAWNKGVALYKHHKHHGYPGDNNTLNSLLVTL